MSRGLGCWDHFASLVWQDWEVLPAPPPVWINSPPPPRSGPLHCALLAFPDCLDQVNPLYWACCHLTSHILAHHPWQFPAHLWLLFCARGASREWEPVTTAIWARLRLLKCSIPAMATAAKVPLPCLVCWDSTSIHRWAIRCRGTWVSHKGWGQPRGKEGNSKGAGRESLGDSEELGIGAEGRRDSYLWMVPPLSPGEDRAENLKCWRIWFGA